MVRVMIILGKCKYKDLNFFKRCSKKNYEKEKRIKERKKEKVWKERKKERKR